MGISDLGGWLKEQLSGSVGRNPLLDPESWPTKPPSYRETINPNVPLPTFSINQDGSYQYHNLQPGTSAFAPMGPMVLKNPGRGLPRFDPTGTYNDNNLPNNMNNFLLVPMQTPEFKKFDYLKPIGGF